MSDPKQDPTPPDVPVGDAALESDDEELGGPDTVKANDELDGDVER